MKVKRVLKEGIREKIRERKRREERLSVYGLLTLIENQTREIKQLYWQNPVLFELFHQRLGVLEEILRELDLLKTDAEAQLKEHQEKKVMEYLSRSSQASRDYFFKDKDK